MPQLFPLLESLSWELGYHAVRQPSSYTGGRTRRSCSTDSWHQLPDLRLDKPLGDSNLWHLSHFIWRWEEERCAAFPGSCPNADLWTNKYVIVVATFYVDWSQGKRYRDTHLRTSIAFLQHVGSTWWVPPRLIVFMVTISLISFKHMKYYTSWHLPFLPVSLLVLLWWKS